MRRDIESITVHRTRPSLSAFLAVTISQVSAERGEQQAGQEIDKAWGSSDQISLGIVLVAEGGWRN